MDKKIKPFYKKWWFWAIIVVVVLFIVFLLIPSNSDNQTQNADTSELTLDQSLAIHGLSYTVSSNTVERVQGSGNYTGISKKDCELIREAVKSSNPDSTYFGDSFCNKLEIKAKTADIDNGNIVWLTDGKNVAKIQTSKDGSKEYISDYSFEEANKTDDFETVLIVAGD